MIRDVPLHERPREKLIHDGPETLGSVDLIALMLRTGTSGESVLTLAQRVINQTGGLRGLTNTTLQELQEIDGIGPAKAVQLLAGVELGRRISRLPPEERPTIRQPGDAARLLMDEMRFLTQEHFYCLYLNMKNQVIAKKCLFVGSLSSSIVHPREVFKEAVLCSAASIICLHNHPSGDTTPSREDLEVTERLIEAGKLMDIEILDHVIIGDQRYYSMNEKGLISG
ncbi:RadC family protein [Risungbinella massiliensis]|uniref:RadC family protein n=1 Tax=Risungbinella massiliensis TaxID=1329796 RepID=UPI0005CC4346|nr:DNA repair protein RadC [Risungbinella massiliensis]